MPESLQLTDLTKRYGQGAPVIANLNYTFRPGTATGLIGPNGSGKTTLLRLLSAVAYPTSGQILYGQLDIHAKPYAYLKHVGHVHANAELPENLTVVELLEWILRERNQWDSDSPSRIDDLLDRVYLDERRYNLIGTYSSGMIQKTQLAAAFIARPQVLLLDEPFRGLDTDAKAAAFELMEDFSRNGGVLLIASHSRDVLGRLCDALLDLPSSETILPNPTKDQ